MNIIDILNYPAKSDNNWRPWWDTALDLLCVIPFAIALGIACLFLVRLGGLDDARDLWSEFF